MAKSTGLGQRLLVDGYNISGDVTSVGSLGGGPALLDCTGIDKEAMERVGGLFDGAAEFTTWWNPGPEANAAHLVLSGLPTASRHLAYLHRNAQGEPVACAVTKQLNLDYSRADDGALSAQTTAQIGDGFPLEWGHVLTVGLEEFAEEGEGTAWDSGITETDHGFAAHLHVLAFTGTSVTVTIQDSADGEDWDDLADAEFTPADDITAERITGSGTVRQHLRVVTSGTFSEAVIMVGFHRREVAA